KTQPTRSAVERRLHTRHRARTIVYITAPGGRRKLCKAVNLSATGAFIETTNLGLRKGQQVVLSFAINLGAVTKLHRRTAVGAPEARAEKYDEDARQASGATAGSNCANCGLYQGAAGSTQGPCQLFPGRQVKAAGWCTAWAPQL